MGTQYTNHFIINNLRNPLYLGHFIENNFKKDISKIGQSIDRKCHRENISLKTFQERLFKDWSF